ncbi:hypothetical protein [Burkholderia sp. BCC1985]|uniref:hypothetical protein n=1 Tax=Burkholderia sp. BCC1985 TaxID=2817442 RepID=UPI002AB1B825|nr:hypothetical protein [Burkholderia sp. BCC1985]
MTEDTHKKLNRWLETVERCLRIGALLLGLMTPSHPHAVASDTYHADQVRHRVQS